MNLPTKYFTKNDNNTVVIET